MKLVAGERDAQGGRPRWKGGNRIRLLENGDELFPAVFYAIESARYEVILETFILFQDKVGLALHACLVAAAQRGVLIDVTVDHYGSPDLTTDFIGSLASVGVRFHVFDPRPLLFGRLRTNLFRRMHRKIVVVDGSKAFVGGINYAADHLRDFGPEAKQDYAVEIEGPIVDDIKALVVEAVSPVAGSRRSASGRMPAPSSNRHAQPHAGDAEALLVVRNNQLHRDDIERQYRIALRGAQREAIIANAYFIPSYTLLKELQHAARRGVRVCLILQGQADMPIVKLASRVLYDQLLRAGVHIFEYGERPLHAKVAVVDEEWATVGSSNLEPLSLSLNLEANVVVRDRAFAHDLRRRLTRVIEEGCTQVDHQLARSGPCWRPIASYLALQLLRYLPVWAGWLPAHRPRLAPAGTHAAAENAVPATVQTVAKRTGDTSPPQPWDWRDSGSERVGARKPDSPKS